MSGEGCGTSAAMKPAALVVMALLSQDPEPPAEPAPPPAAEQPAAPADQPGEQPVATPAPGAPPPKSKGADDVARLIKKFPDMKPEERAAAIAEIQKQYGTYEYNPVVPPADVDFEKYAGLPLADQVKVIARRVFADLIAGDAPGFVTHAGFPFMLEGRRIDRPEELRNEWAKSLRAKRTDLLSLYDIEVLTPAEMEKKYGKPPQRLSRWDWRAPNTFVAIGNLSGHATVLLMRQVGAAWQVVGFHD